MAPRPIECTASVQAVRFLAPEIVEVDLGMLEPPELRFEAGQWVSVPFGPKIVRAYTIASTPRSATLITLCADVAPGGIGSEWFRSLRPGQTVRFKGPSGGFVFRRSDPRRVLFVAEEIGIVPIRSMLTELYDTGFGRDAKLVYWGRDPDWLAYDREFRSLARRYPSFAYRPVARDAPVEWHGDRGEVADVVDRVVRGVDNLVAYVSGGGDKIDRVRAVLMAKGLERKSVRWERFW